MAAPNIVSVSTITGITTQISGINSDPKNANGVTGSANPCGITTVVSNAASSGKVFKINLLSATGIGNTVDFTAKIFNAAAGLGNSVGIAVTVAIPQYSSVVIISKENALYLEENRSIGVQRGIIGDADVICSYEEIS